MILIYSDRYSSRLRYSLDLIFHTLLGTNYELIHDEAIFLQTVGPKLMYASNPQPQADVVTIRAVELLFEKGLKDQQISIGQHNDLKTLFRTSKRYSLPYDLFAAVFYLVSRYEEYLPHRSDEHDRFLHTESIAWREGFLETAIIDRWVGQLRELIVQKWPELGLQPNIYRFQPTIDIDQLYAYRQKSWVRQLGGLFKELQLARWQAFRRRLRVMAGGEIDPFDTYDWLNTQHREYDATPIYFILMGDYGLHDNAHNPHNDHFREHIRTLADRNVIGLHPSVRSTMDQSLIDREKKLLEQILNRPVTLSRQHFLKLRLPQTYQQLVKRDFTADFSMGYAAAPGFRSGTATPHFFYDLDHESPIKLKIYPTILMDVSLQGYLRLTPDQAIEKSEQLIRECKEVGGTFVSLWHNSSFSTPDGWEGWHRVYRQLLETAKA